ncbi:MAG: hypothetical protein KC502_23245 [Myxococcales bacterium]|nr:hypothetical protein [Myxococcales bacterium]
MALRKAVLIAAIIGLSATLFSTSAFARGTIRQGKSWGIGLTGAFGGSSGISFKTFMGRRLALQVSGGGAFGNGKAVPSIGADLLLEMPRLAGGRIIKLAWNVGGGARTALGKNSGVWVHGVVGLELLFKPVPIDLVIEWTPTFFGTGGADVDVRGAGTHIRWWF